MKVKTLRLKNFKRFTDLTIKGIPASARLVALVGPNGSGKSSVFEAFNVISWRTRVTNLKEEGYWIKAEDSSDPELYSIDQISTLFNKQVSLDLHDHQITLSQDTAALEADKKAFYIRSCYRHEDDFAINSFNRTGDLLDEPSRPQFLISRDSRVSANYQRLVCDAVEQVFDSTLNTQTTRGEIRDELIGKVRDSLSRVLPTLELIGPGNPLKDGTFFFKKGRSQEWKYKNLSGGEKAAFDLILDFVVKTQRFDNTVFCIDEPETHMNPVAQASLLNELINLLPPNCQLWVATHSVGMMKAAENLYQNKPGEVAFLDFGEQDFDQPLVIEPSIPNRAFWKRNLAVSLGNIASLVSPKHIVFCESASTNADGLGFDAKCYDIIFSEEYPDTEFISVGSATEIQRNALSLSAVLGRVLSGVTFTTIRDRDDASEAEIEEWREQGVGTLSRRSIESFLWDDEILQKLCHLLGSPDKIDDVIALKHKELNNSRQRGYPEDDMKSAAGNLYSALRATLNTVGRGTNRKAFSTVTLAPLITPETQVYQELKRDIFSQ